MGLESVAMATSQSYPNCNSLWARAAIYGGKNNFSNAKFIALCQIVASGGTSFTQQKKLDQTKTTVNHREGNCTFPGLNWLPPVVVFERTHGILVYLH